MNPGSPKSSLIPRWWQFRKRLAWRRAWRDLILDPANHPENIFGPIELHK